MQSPADAQDNAFVAAAVGRLRCARVCGGDSQLAEFAPSPGHPMYVPVLLELIRFDLAWHRSRGVEKSADDYRRSFPSLFADPEAARAVAAAGAAGPGGSWAASGGGPLLWHPSAGSFLGSEAAPPGPEGFAPDAAAPLREAAEVYRRFREGGAGAGDEALTSAYASVGLRVEVADLFRDVHRTSPEAADRLARGTLALPSAGDEFLGFELVDEIGRGAFGRVFLARQKDLANRQVVLKVTAEPAGESQTLAQLQHTNIVPVYSAHSRDPLHALCMPFFGTTTLADVLGALGSGARLPLSGKHFVSTVHDRRKATRVLSTIRPKPTAAAVAAPDAPTAAPPADNLGAAPAKPEERVSTLAALEGLSYENAVLWVGARLADGLAHAHERGILHRDLKPANVLLTDDGVPMLLDFNLSEDTKLRSSAAAARVGGTLPYMAPEQLEAFRGGGAPDERSDLYSLGLILFELLSGRHAFPLRPGSADLAVPQMLEDRRSLRPGPRRHNARVSPAAEAIVLRCLEPDPSHRYRSARELREDLERHLADLPLRHVPEPSWRERARKWRRRHPRLTSSTSVALCCGAVLLACAALLVTRLREVRRLEAQDALAGFRERTRAAKFLLNKSAPDRKQLEEGARLCDEALTRYAALDGGPRDDLPAVRDLPPADRAALRAEIREALLTRARAATLLAEGEQDSGRRRERAEFGLRVLRVAGPADPGAGGSKAALLQAAELHQLLGHDDEARKLRADAEGVTPRAAVEFYLLALRLGDRREFARALPLLREATRRNPQDVWAWFYEGFCHQESGADAEAVRCYTAAVALAPRGADAYLPYYNRGLAYARLGQYAEAVADFDEALRLRPGDADARVNRGIARTQWGRYAEAEADFDEALRADPSVTRVYFLRSVARARAGDAAGARKDREEGLRQDPADELSWIDRALARVADEPAAALADLDRALALNPRSLFALQNKAHVLADRLGRQEEAVAVLNKAVELYPGFVRARIGRGVSLARLGRRAEALEDVRESLARSTGPETLYQAANVYALTSRQHPDDALECFPLVSLALRQGFGLDAVDTDPDFDPVRNHPEFRRVVKSARDLHAPAPKQAGKEGGR